MRKLRAGIVRDLWDDVGDVVLMLAIGVVAWWLFGWKPAVAITIGAGILSGPVLDMVTKGENDG